MTQSTTTKSQENTTPTTDAPDLAKSALASAREALGNAGELMDEAASAAKTKSRELSGRVRESLDEANTRLSEAKDAMKDVAARSRSELEALYTELAERYQALVIRARELAEKTRRKLASMEIGQRRDQVIDFVRTNPGASTLIAFAGGLLVGFAIRPRYR